MNLRHELFYLAYYLHWQPSEILGLSVGERKAYVALLNNRIAEENQRYE